MFIIQGYRYDAFTASNGAEKQKLYIGAYLSSVTNPLNSISGVTPLKDTSGTKNTTNAVNYAHYEAVCALFLIRFKTRDFRTALGNGHYTEGKKTGEADEKGMFYKALAGESNKMFGLEDFYGYGATVLQNKEGFPLSTSGWVTDLLFSGNYPLAAKTVGGSSTTYYGSYFENTGAGYNSHLSFDRSSATQNGLFAIGNLANGNTNYFRLKAFAN